MPISLRNETQRRYLVLFENHVDLKTGEIFDKQFERDVIKLRSMEPHELALIPSTGGSTPLARFNVKYGFPAEMVEFLFSYIVNNEIDLSLIRSGMYIVSDATQKAVGWSGTDEESFIAYDGIATYNQTKSRRELKFIIPANVTLKQAKDFLTQNWGFVKDQQSHYLGVNDKAKADTIRPHFNAKRDYRVLELLESGAKYNDVAVQIQKEYPGYSPTYMEIAKIKSKLKTKDIEI